MGMMLIEFGAGCWPSRLVWLGLMIQTDTPKSQLISKAIYGLLTSPKTQTDKFVLFAVKGEEANKLNLSVCVLGEVSRP